MTNRDALLKLVASFPLIDNHAHNLLTADSILTCPLEVCFSEARGEALKDAVQTSALKQAIQHLARLYKCAPSWDEIKRVRDTVSYDELCKASFETIGIQSLLLDDGLYDLGNLLDIKKHVGLVEDVRRIVRVESIAESVLKNLIESVNKSHEAVISFAEFEEPLRNQLRSLAESEEVVAFKSIAAYRSGLNINCNLTNEEVAVALGNFLRVYTSSATEQGTLKLTDKVIIDHVVNVAIDIAFENGIPIQFHTGLGDNDLDLLYSNPLYLRPLIEKYKDTKIVLLHASYPYARQAAYLASVYSNVYVDIGLISSLISTSGQQSILRELLELSPTNRMLFSTDGHCHPESFYVSVVQSRDVIGKVLLESVDNKDFTVDEAIKIAKQIFFENSNALYKLNLTPKISSNVDYFAYGVSGEKKISILKSKGVKLVRLAYLDNSSQYRIRLIPIDRFQDYVAFNGVTSLRALTALPFYADKVPKGTGVNASGECIIKPDLSTLLQLPYYPEHAIVHGFFENKWTPVDPEYGKPYLTEDSKYFSLCPRNCLRKIVDAARNDFGISFLAGFESEFVLLKNTQDSVKPIPVDDTLYLLAASFRGNNSAAVIDKIVDSLSQLNIPIEQCHSESASGQFEVVTGPLTPLNTADNCVLTRNTIYDVASQFGLKATFVPKPFNNQAGTGAHLHISLHEINKPEKENDGHSSGLSPYERSFVAGVIHHIKAICAFTLPTAHSYTRTVDHCWAGSWVCWGVENRETPIRVCYRPKKGAKGETTFDINFEHKFVDATSNPYLVISAIIAAGLDGIKRKLELNTPPCLDDPASLTDEERKNLGIVERMPGSLRETLDALKNDTVLIDALGEPLVRCYVGVKESELNFCKDLSAEKQLEALLRIERLSIVAVENLRKHHKHNIKTYKSATRTLLRELTKEFFCLFTNFDEKFDIMAHFPLLIKIVNVLAYFLFLGSSVYSFLFFDDEDTQFSLEDRHPTYITPASYVYGIWGLIHLLLLGFIIYQFFPKADGVVTDGIHWHFLFIALLISLSQSLYESDYLIISWIVTLLVASQVSYVYYTIKNKYPSNSLAETVWIHFPFSLFHAWIVVLAVLGLFAAFTSKDDDDESPSFFIQLLVLIGLLFLEGTAVSYIEKFKGDIAGALVIDWVLIGVAIGQDDTFIRIAAIILAAITTLHIIKALVYDRYIKKVRNPTPFAA
ncbi:5769_t:CDS:10 [Acaulospora morrowiae]|uniref:Glutamine synthetase n=1 Tax=Acaulospora morrowiae TaxID=94023 RepID=A0A9N8WJC5_9GLOM|nr:5769_t:CDS:10 [Acaulospora morrowiae]